MAVRDPITATNTPAGTAASSDLSAKAAAAGFGGGSPSSSTSSSTTTSSTTGGGITSSSGNARQEEAKTGTDIMNMSAPAYKAPSSNTKYLDDYEKTLMSIQQANEASINASADQSISDTKQTQAGEVGGESTKLARMGGYLGDSASGTGAMLKLVAAHRAEVAGLESKRQSLLTDARTAFADKMFDVAKAKADEAKYVESETYKRQQDFFSNTEGLLKDQNTIQNQERDDARSVITNIISNSNGKGFDQMDEETQKTIIDSAEKAGYPLGVIKNMLELPKQQAAAIDQLVKDAAKRGAPQSILMGISTSKDFATAASLAAPYLAKGTGTGSGSGSGSGAAGNDLKLSLIPTQLRGVVAQNGSKQIALDLMGSTPPGWFGPVLEAIGTEKGMSIDPSGKLAQDAWSSFKKDPQIGYFQKEVNKKVLGSPTGGGSSFDYSSVDAAAPDTSQ